jgi:hypothetical protein
MQFSDGAIEIQHQKMLSYNKIALVLQRPDAILWPDVP